jgi:hypothetical protein
MEFIMKKIMNKITDAKYNMLAAGTVAIIFAAEEAKAQPSTDQGVGDVASTVEGQLTNIASLVVAGAFLIGIAFVAMGLMRLKAAVDSQGQQVKYSEGMWRLGLGAALVALPAVTGTGIGTLFGSDGGGQKSDLTGLFAE